MENSKHTRRELKQLQQAMMGNSWTTKNMGRALTFLVTTKENMKEDLCTTNSMGKELSNMQTEMYIRVILKIIRSMVEGNIYSTRWKTINNTLENSGRIGFMARENWSIITVIHILGSFLRTRKMVSESTYGKIQRFWREHGETTKSRACSLFNIQTKDNKKEISWRMNVMESSKSVKTAVLLKSNGLTEFDNIHDYGH